MNILFLHGGYWPYPAATNRAASDLAEGLAARGHHVQVLALGPSARNAPADPRGRRRRRLGVRIERVADCGIGGFGRWNKLLNTIKYHAVAARWLFGKRDRAFDVVLTLDSPPGLRVSAGLAAWWCPRRRVRHVPWFMDLTTEARTALRASPGPGVVRWLRAAFDRMEGTAANRAALCVVIGRCMAERLARAGVPPERIATLPLWNLGGDHRPVPVDSSDTLLARFGWTGRCVVLYSGHAGAHHDFSALREAAQLLRDDRDIVFLLAGDSPVLADLAAWARDEGLANLGRIERVPADEFPALLLAGSLHLVTLRAGLEGTCVPSKFYGSLAAGRPTLFIGAAESEVARAIREADAGRVIAPGDGAGLADAIRRLARDPAEAARLGANARRVYVERYRREMGVDRWDHCLRTLVDSPPSGNARPPAPDGEFALDNGMHPPQYPR